LRQQLLKLEKRMAEINERKRANDAALADPSLYDGDRADRRNELTRNAAALSAQLGEVEEKWLQAQAEIEALTPAA